MGGRVVFTGGSGKVGSLVIADLVKHGYEVLNLDLGPPTMPGINAARTANADTKTETETKTTDAAAPKVHTMKVDLTDAGQVFSALVSPMRLSEPFPAELPGPPDAVLHFAAHSTPMVVPDNETFKNNVLATHNIIEAACKLGVKKIILASSITTYGVAFGQGKKDYPAFPVTEDLDVNPTDPYALSKIVGETVARSFATKYGVDVYCLRIGRVFAPEEYNEGVELEDEKGRKDGRTSYKGIFSCYVHSPLTYAHGWSYTDARDLGQMCRKGIETSGLGWQIFNATNDHITTVTPTMQFLKENVPQTSITREMGEFEAPISNRKIKEMLGFKEEYDWWTIFEDWRDKAPPSASQREGVRD